MNQPNDKDPNPIFCCIVEEHGDIYAYFHAFFRKFKPSKEKKISLVHFDAHPDMAIPNHPKSLSLYDSYGTYDNIFSTLNSDDGIAEFIIPLFYLGLISSCEWIRSPWSDQIEDGKYSFNVMDLHSLQSESSRIVCDLNIPYYQESNTFYGQIKDLPPEFETRNAFQVNLKVLLAKDATQVLQTQTRTYQLEDHRIKNKASHTFIKSQAISESRESCAWVLDICLDYFSTSNPFLVDLEMILRKDFATIDEEAHELMKWIQWGTSQITILPIEPLETASGSASKIRSSQSASQSQLKNLFHSDRLWDLQSRMAEVHKAGKFQDLLSLLEDSLALIECGLSSYEFLSIFQTERLLFRESQTNSPVHVKEHEDLENVKKSLLFLFSLSKVSLPSRKEIFSILPHLSLPNHLSSHSEIQAAVLEMLDFLLHRIALRELDPFPMFITIARSSNDEFTPNSQVDFIQFCVLKALDAMFSMLATLGIGSQTKGTEANLRPNKRPRNNSMELTPPSRSNTRDNPLFNKLLVHDMVNEPWLHAYTHFLSDDYLSSAPIPEPPMESSFHSELENLLESRKPLFS